MNEKLPFGLQFEVEKNFAQRQHVIYNPANGISWVDTSSGLQPLVEWDWYVHVATSTRNNDEDVERPPTTTVTEHIEPSE